MPSSACHFLSGKAHEEGLGGKRLVSGRYLPRVLLQVAPHPVSATMESAPIGRALRMLGSMSVLTQLKMRAIRAAAARDSAAAAKLCAPPGRQTPAKRSAGEHVVRSLHSTPASWRSSKDFAAESGENVVRIGDVVLSMSADSQPELVPVGFGMAEDEGQETLAHLQWMMQKFALGQDMFLLNGPGPTARRLALHFCEVLGLEAELVRISRDTTESDLKVRREISAGTATWSDQAPVRAAIHGRVLILDGIEKVVTLVQNLLCPRLNS